MRSTALFPLAGASRLAAVLLGPLAPGGMRAAWARLRSRDAGPPVMVVVVGTSDAVARLRGAAGPILMAAGLGRCRIEMGSASATRGPPPLPPAPHRSRLPQGLASKPTLTLGEALMLLDQDLR